MEEPIPKEENAPSTSHGEETTITTHLDFKSFESMCFAYELI
jgi:hypothetical protein